MENPSWSRAEWGDDKKQYLTPEEVTQKKQRKQAYVYNDIENFKIFLQKKKNKSLQNTRKTEIEAFNKKVTIFQEETEYLWTPEMKTYIQDHTSYGHRTPQTKQVDPGADQVQAYRRDAMGRIITQDGAGR